MSLFKKIIDKEIPADIVYEDDQCLAFKDIQPQAPIHWLLIPKKEIASMAELESTDAPLLGHMMLVVQKLAKEHGFADQGFRLVANTNQDGGQTVYHLHFHILAGRSLLWPPG